MGVTRDADFPSEAAELMQAFNRCADGHSVNHVIEAAANFAIMTFHGYGRTVGDTKEAAVARAAAFGEKFAASVAEQWDRAGEPTDIIVPLGGN